jgi:hypothetical protein
MKRLILYGLTPLGLILVLSRPTQSGKDQTQAWADYKKAVAEQDRIDKAERLRVDAMIKERADSYYAELKAKYPVREAGGGGPPLGSDYKSFFQPMPETHCNHQSYEAPRNNYFDQNDNSGLYYQRTIVGKNAGEWSIQLISGP